MSQTKFFAFLQRDTSNLFDGEYFRSAQTVSLTLQIFNFNPHETHLLRFEKNAIEEKSLITYKMNHIIITHYD